LHLDPPLELAPSALQADFVVQKSRLTALAAFLVLSLSGLSLLGLRRAVPSAKDIIRCYGH
jgi:hypothetical protein